MRWVRQKRSLDISVRVSVMQSRMGSYITKPVKIIQMSTQERQTKMTNNIASRSKFFGNFAPAFDFMEQCSR